jgi:hypothetical protein
MIVDEAAVIKLGVSLAKALFKYWLKDASLAADVSSSFVDLIGTVTTSERARRRARRQFEQIGEQIAESLLPIFEMEASRVDEAGCKAIVLAAAEAIENTKIDPALLAKENLDPNALAEIIGRSRSEHTKHFSRDETALYDRVISEASQYVIDSASRFPKFSERVFAEVLECEDHLLTLVQQVLKEVSQIRAESVHANVEAVSAQFEAEYIRAVVRNLDQLELFGANVDPSSQRHRLSVAYITLAAMETPEMVEPGPIPALGPGDSHEYSESETEPESPESVDAILMKS